MLDLDKMQFLTQTDKSGRLLIDIGGLPPLLELEVIVKGRDNTEDWFREAVDAIGAILDTLRTPSVMRKSETIPKAGPGPVVVPDIKCPSCESMMKEEEETCPSCGEIRAIYDNSQPMEIQNRDPIHDWFKAPADHPYADDRFARVCSKCGKSLGMASLDEREIHLPLAERRAILGRMIQDTATEFCKHLPQRMNISFGASVEETARPWPQLEDIASPLEEE